VLTAGGKTLVTTSLSGVKLVNAVKAITTPDGTQQQTIFIKQQQQQQQQPEQQQQQQTIIGTIQQQPQLLQQHANKVSCVAAHAASIGMRWETISHSFGWSHEHGRAYLVE
jgi:ABC-type phosphate/phosphonate transport system ATPase subunit